METNVINEVNELKPTVQLLKSTLVNLSEVSLEDGRNIIAAVVKEGNLHTKNTVRSYVVAISGPELAVRHATKLLLDGDLSAICGTEITWERTVYPAGVAHERNGSTVILEEDDVIDHIVDVNVSPIKLTLFLSYIEGKELSPLMEKIILKGFEIDSL